MNNKKRIEWRIWAALCVLLVLLAGMRQANAEIRYVYDQAGRLTSVNYGNGTVITYTYDKAGNLLSRQVTTSTSPPGPATLISPSGTITTTSPAYRWNAVAAATWYYLWVDDSTGSGKIKTWYTSQQAGCASGTGTCSVTPTTALAAGSGQWWIQTWNDYGYGSWSAGMQFQVSAAAPGKVTQISPVGAITTTSPTYTWNAEATATWYYLWVNDSAASGKIKTWYTSQQASCASGTGTCFVTPSTALSSGSGQWWIQTWNDYGYGPWSDGLTFNIAGCTAPPAKATLLSPTGATASQNPTYTWNAVAGATWYYLWVNDAAASGKVLKWYTAAQAGCASGTGACSVTPGVTLALGVGQWWIQTWNDCGYGPWSDALTFTVGGGGIRAAKSARSALRTIATRRP